jgi:hypothetical protein
VRGYLDHEPGVLALSAASGAWIAEPLVPDLVEHNVGRARCRSPHDDAGPGFAPALFLHLTWISRGSTGFGVCR